MAVTHCNDPTWVTMTLDLHSGGFLALVHENKKTNLTKIGARGKTALYLRSIYYKSRKNNNIGLLNLSYWTTHIHYTL